MNANMPAYPITEETKTEHYGGATYITATATSLGLTKREELSARFGAALLPVYLDTVLQYESSEAMVKCWAESSVEFADALIKQWGK
jgi:hypothetical protein